MLANPFNPGAGRRPPYLAGRDKIMQSIRSDMARVLRSGEGSRPVCLSGLRGMGKTVFLREIFDAARDDGWFVAWTEASRNEPLAKKLTKAIYPELRRSVHASKPLSSAFEHALAVFRSFQMKVDPEGVMTFGLDVSPARGFADAGDFARDLEDLLQALGESAADVGSAVFIAVDELQEASGEDLSALNRALHAVGQGASPVPVYFVGAGLPTLPAVLAEASSYAERMYRFYSLGLLDDDAARAAFVEPTLDEGLTWESDALAYALHASQGYPYFIQQCGFSICEQLSEPCVIDKACVTDGIGLATAELDSGLYRSRWDRATPAGREFLKAMICDEGASRVSDVAGRLGKEVGGVSPLRDRLIRDGLIYRPERGFVEFTVPGMADFIRRHAE